MKKNIKSYQLIFGTLALVAGLFAITTPSVASAETLERQLEVGSTGTDVSALQAFLAQDNTLYPEGKVTGYFGTLTKAAVVRFQNRNGISSVGRVGPATLLVLNVQMPGGIANSGTAPTISNVGINPGRNSALINWNTNEFAKGVVYFSSTPLVTYEYPHSVDVSGNIASTDSSYRTIQNVMIQGLQSNTTYYYMIYTTDQSGNVSVTWPSTFQTSI